MITELFVWIVFDPWESPRKVAEKNRLPKKLDR